MNTDETARNLKRLIGLVSADKIKSIRIAQVTDVDENNHTVSCKITSSGLELFNVRLDSIIDSITSYFTVIPEIGSYILIGKIDGFDSEYCVLKTSTISKILIKIGQRTLVVDDKLFEFNGGNNEGLIKIDKLQSKLKDLESKYNGHTHTIITGGITVALNPSGVIVNPAPVSVPATTSTSNGFQTQTTHPFDYEDDMVKH